MAASQEEEVSATPTLVTPPPPDPMLRVVEKLGADPSFLTYRAIPLHTFVENTLGVEIPSIQELVRMMTPSRNAPETPGGLVLADYLDAFLSTTQWVEKVSAFARVVDFIVETASRHLVRPLEMSPFVPAAHLLDDNHDDGLRPPFIGCTRGSRLRSNLKLTWQDVDFIFEFGPGVFHVTADASKWDEDRVARVKRTKIKNPLVECPKVVAPSLPQNLDVQLAFYAQEKFGHSVHLDNFIQVLLLDETLVVYSHDRAGVAVSEPINWRKEPLQLVFIVAAMALHGQNQLYDPVDQPSAIPDTHCVFMDSLEWDTPHEIRQDFANNVPHEEIPGQNILVRFANRIHSDDSLFGRGTRVYDVVVYRKGSEALERLWPKTQLVAKISWQRRRKHFESEIIRRAREVDPEHTPAVFASKVLRGRAPSQTLREEAKEPPSEGEKYNHKPLDLEIIISRKYLKARHLSPEDSLRAFKEVVVCHRRLYQHGGILHQDPSAENIMALTRQGIVVGILNDYDLSIITEQGAEVASSRRGTVTFMARELLIPEFRNIPQNYVHDLEALYYVFAYITIDREKGKKNFLRHWHWLKDSDLADAKLSFTRQEHRLRGYLQKSKQPAQLRALISLQRLFFEGMVASEEAWYQSGEAKSQHEAFCKAVNWESFAKALSICPLIITQLRDPSHSRSFLETLKKSMSSLRLSVG